MPPPLALIARLGWSGSRHQRLQHFHRRLVAWVAGEYLVAVWCLVYPTCSVTQTLPTPTSCTFMVAQKAPRPSAWALLGLPKSAMMRVWTAVASQTLVLDQEVSRVSHSQAAPPQQSPAP